MNFAGIFIFYFIVASVGLAMLISIVLCFAFRRRVWGVAILTIFSLLVSLSLYVAGVSLMPHRALDATWDFRSTRSPNNVADWPGKSENAYGGAYFAERGIFKKLTILMPGRPPLVSRSPLGAAIGVAKGQVVSASFMEGRMPFADAVKRMKELSDQLGWK